MAEEEGFLFTPKVHLLSILRIAETPKYTLKHTLSVGDHSFRPILRQREAGHADPCVHERIRGSSANGLVYTEKGTRFPEYLLQL
jgi:hypothetical protein